MARKAYEPYVCSCGERCVMVPHEKTGKLAPITVATHVNGNVEIVSERSGEPASVYRIVPKAARADAGMLRLNHWSNCPDAARFRR